MPSLAGYRIIDTGRIVAGLFRIAAQSLLQDSESVRINTAPLKIPLVRNLERGEGKREIVICFCERIARFGSGIALCRSPSSRRERSAASRADGERERAKRPARALHNGYHQTLWIISRDLSSVSYPVKVDAPGRSRCCTQLLPSVAEVIAAAVARCGRLKASEVVILSHRHAARSDDQ